MPLQAFNNQGLDRLPAPSRRTYYLHVVSYTHHYCHFKFHVSSQDLHSGR